MDEMPTLLAGRYRLDEQIASGGMGAIWRAHDTVLQRPVAIKMLHEHLADDDRASDRFRREALTAASVQHPNMANVYDYIEDEGRPGIVMEFVDCRTLAHELSRGRLDVGETMRITDEVLAALEAAHAAGIVHRDIKPGNILLCADGAVKVADFGIARTLGDASLTHTGTVMGTAHYAAPEQVRGEPAVPQSDLYALGVVLYEMLTGARPFTADTPVGVAIKRLAEDPTPPRALRADLPPSVERFVMRAMARETDDRFASATDMRAALRGLRRAGETPTAAFPLAGPHAQTVALRVAEPAPAALADRVAPVVEAVPPRWAWRRLAFWLVPLAAVAAGLVLVLWLVSRPRIATVPTLKGTSIEAARDAADDAGFTLRVTETENDSAVGTVLTQRPSPGAEIELPASIAVTVSSGPPPCCDVPNLEGMTIAQARAALDRARLDADVRYDTTTRAPAGAVLSQSVEPGERVEPGTEVEITVARAPERRDEDRGRGKGKGDNDD